MYNRKLKTAIKIISTILLIAFITYDISWATGGEIPVSFQANNSVSGANLISLKIPPTFGTIKETFIPKEGRGQKLIIHIQDAHLIYEAQKNLSNILEELIKNYELNLILVEGGEGDLGLSHLRKYPEKRRKDVAEKYLKEGKIAGEEYLDITSSYPLKLRGIEEGSLYSKNVDLFFATSSFRKETEPVLIKLHERVGLLKQFVFNKNLLDLDGAKKDFTEDNDLAKYSSYLASKAATWGIDIKSHSNYNVFLDLKKLEEKIDFDAAQKERNRLAELLLKTLYKEELENLIATSVDFRENRLSAEEYYRYLENLAMRSGILFDEYENLSRYIDYVGRYEHLDVLELFNEIRLIEDAIKEKYITSEEERELSRISYNLDILIEFFALKLLPHQHSYFKENKSGFSVAFWNVFLNGCSQKYGLEKIDIDPSSIDSCLGELEKFYDVASERDQAFAKNALRIMEQTQENVAVLIAGGFHTPNLTHILREENISYIVIAPKITAGEFDDELYEYILKLKNTSHLRPRPARGTPVMQLLTEELAGEVSEELKDFHQKSISESEKPQRKPSMGARGVKRLREIFNSRDISAEMCDEALSILVNTLPHREAPISYAMKIKLLLLVREFSLGPYCDRLTAMEKLNISSDDFVSIIKVLADAEELHGILPDALLDNIIRHKRSPNRFLKTLKHGAKLLIVFFTFIFFVGCRSYQIAHHAIESRMPEKAFIRAEAKDAEEVVSFKQRRRDPGTYRAWINHVWTETGEDYRMRAKGSLPDQLGSKKPVAVGFMHDVEEPGRPGYIYENPLFSLRNDPPVLMRPLRWLASPFIDNSSSRQRIIPSPECLSLDADIWEYYDSSGKLLKTEEEILSEAATVRNKEIGVEFDIERPKFAWIRKHENIEHGKAGEIPVKFYTYATKPDYLYAMAVAYESDGFVSKAHDLYRQIQKKHPKSKAAQEASERIDDLQEKVRGILKLVSFIGGRAQQGVQAAGPDNETLTLINSGLNAILEMDDEVQTQQILKGLERARNRGGAVLLSDTGHSNAFGLRLRDLMPFNNGYGKVMDPLPLDGISLAVGDKSGTFVFTFATFASGDSTFGIHYHAHVPHGKTVTSSPIYRTVTFGHEVPAVQLTHDDASVRTWGTELFAALRKLTKHGTMQNPATGVSTVASITDSLIDGGYQIWLLSNLRKLPEAADGMFFRKFNNPVSNFSKAAGGAKDLLFVDSPQSKKPAYTTTVEDLLGLVNTQRIPEGAKDNAGLILGLSPEGEQLKRLEDLLDAGCSIEDLRVMMFMCNADYDQSAVPVMRVVNGKPTLFYVNYTANRAVRYMTEQVRSAKAVDGSSFVAYIPVFFENGKDSGRWAAQINILFNEYGQAVEVSAKDANGNVVRKLIDPETGEVKIITLERISENKKKLVLSEETSVMKDGKAVPAAQRDIVIETISPNERRILSEEYTILGNKKTLTMVNISTEKLVETESGSVWQPAGSNLVKPLEGKESVIKTDGEEPSYKGRLFIIDSSGNVIKQFDGKVIYKDGKYVVSGIRRVHNTFLSKDRSFGKLTIPKGTPIRFHYGPEGEEIEYAVCIFPDSSYVTMIYYTDSVTGKINTGVINSRLPLVEEVYNDKGNLLEVRHSSEIQGVKLLVKLVKPNGEIISYSDYQKHGDDYKAGELTISHFDGTVEKIRHLHAQGRAVKTIIKNGVPVREEGYLVKEGWKLLYSKDLTEKRDKKTGILHQKEENPKETVGSEKKPAEDPAKPQVPEGKTPPEKNPPKEKKGLLYRFQKLFSNSRETRIHLPIAAIGIYPSQMPTPSLQLAQIQRPSIVRGGDKKTESLSASKKDEQQDATSKIEDEDAQEDLLDADFPILKTRRGTIRSGSYKLRLRGVALADPALTPKGHYSEADFDVLKEMGVNTIRLPLIPEQHSPPKFDLIDKYIKMAHQRDMWVIIDYHAFGPDIAADNVIKWWKKVAEHYKGKRGIIFELFNEPHSTEKDPLTWESWRDRFNKLIAAIREIDQDKLLLIGGTDYGYDLRGVRDGYGITDPAEKFAYATHPYPKKAGKLDDRWGYIMQDKEAPVVVTEFGYDQDGSGKEFDSDGSSTKKLFRYIHKSRTECWVAWCYNPQWKPRIISDWDHTKTPFGEDMAKEIRRSKMNDVSDRVQRYVMWAFLFVTGLAVARILQIRWRRHKRRQQILQSMPEGARFMDNMFHRGDLTTARNKLLSTEGRLWLVNIMLARFNDFGRRSGIIRGSPASSEFVQAISFLITLKHRPQELDGRALPMTLDKNEVDELLQTIDLGPKYDLFRALDGIAKKIGFENLDPALRYIFIKILEEKNGELVAEAESLAELTKAKILEQYEQAQPDGIYAEQATFANISKHIMLPIVSRENYMGFNNERPLKNMPKVLLIGSYMDDKLRPGLFRAPQLGLHRIASYLEAFGIEVDVYDVLLDGEEGLTEMVKEKHYEFIGFNVLHPALEYTLNVMEKIRRVSPDSVFVAGGQGASFNHELLITKTPADIVTKAFGEFAMLDMVTGYSPELETDQFMGQRGLYVKSPDGNAVDTGQVTPYTQDDLSVVSLALDFQKIPYERYWETVAKAYSPRHLKMMKATSTKNTIRLFTGTHCPMNCSFCSSTNFLNYACGKVQKVRMLTAEDIALLMNRSIRAHPEVDSFYFNDDNFMIDERRVREFCDIVDKDFATKNLKFICMSRADTVNTEILRRMKRSGFSTVSLGIESFSDKILDDMGKNLKKNGKPMQEIAIEAVEETLREGLNARINFIMFYPTTTFSDLRITIDTATELIAKGAPPTHYYFVEPYPGARIVEEGYDKTTVYRTFKVEGNDHQFRLATAIHPVNEGIRKLATEAVKCHEKSVKKFKKKYNSSLKGDLPSSVDTLILFYDIYRLGEELGVADEDVSTERIEEVIARFMQADEKKTAEVKLGRPALHKIDAAMEILQYHEKEIISALEEANDLLSSNGKGSGENAITLLKKTAENVLIAFKMIDSARDGISYDEDLIEKIMSIKETARTLAILQKNAQKQGKLVGKYRLAKSEDEQKEEKEKIMEMMELLETSTKDLFSSLPGEKQHTSQLVPLMAEISAIKHMVNDSPAIGTSKQKSQIEYLVEKVTYYMNLLLTASLSEAALTDLPREAEFREAGHPTSPRVVYKNLEDTLKYALEEIRIIGLQPNPEIRSLLFPDRARKVQVGSKKFNFEEREGWQGWIYRGEKGTESYKDLIIEEVPAIISGLSQDLRVARERVETEKVSIEEAIKSARKERAATTQKNVDLFEGWDPEERAYKSLRSRYGLPLTVITLASLYILIFTGYLVGRPILFPLQFIDTVISWLSFATLFYMVYISIYGYFCKTGHFRVQKKNLASSIPIERLLKILPESARQRLHRYNSTTTIMNMLTTDEFKKVLADHTANTCIYIDSLPKNIKLEALSRLGINVLESELDSMTPVLIENILALLDNRETWGVREKELINQVFPLQVILIPAVNDPNIINQVQHKVNIVQYPNTTFLLALEERDKRALEMVERAKADGTLPENVMPYFGAMSTVNAPGQQRKPQNKPKTVNKTVSHMLSKLEDLSEYPKLPFDETPDSFMIWDLEDDPGVAQLWSMKIAKMMIKSTYQEVVELMMAKAPGVPDFFSIQPKTLKKINPDLFARVEKWGIDLHLPEKLSGKYIMANRKMSLMESGGMEFGNSREKLKEMIHLIGIRVDIEMFDRIEKGLIEEEAVDSRRHEYDVKPYRLRERYEELLGMLDAKYSSRENFMMAEFERRSIPVNYQGILVAKMYGENPMSHLEWLSWFDLMLPGFSAYRFDATIIPSAFIGSIAGSIFFGVFGGVAGVFVGGAVGFIIGKLLLSLGFDTRGKVALAFSAGTTNNFDFDTLFTDLSGYPEYNVAEDWATALKMAKMEYRSFLVNGFLTPTYEESFPKLGPRWWGQHSRWMGGHLQSIPQVISDPRKSIKDYGFWNWFHAFYAAILLSISAPLFFYALLRTAVWIVLLGATSIAGLLELGTLYAFLSGIINQFYMLIWWIPESVPLSVSLFFVGPVIVYLLGLVPVLKSRPDTEEMVTKSIDDIRRIAEEYRTRTNGDINKLFEEIAQLRVLADELEAEKSSESLQIRAKALRDRQQELIEKQKMRGTQTLWDDPEINAALAEIYELLIYGDTKEPRLNMAKPWHEIRVLADKLDEALNDAVDREVERLQKRIKKLEEGVVSLGFIKIKLGKTAYAKYELIKLNLIMPYYYCHIVVAVILYVLQIKNEMDTHWRQTPHRFYGEQFGSILKETLLDETKTLKHMISKNGSATNLSRQKVDEKKETHPALEEAANEGRMFALKPEEVERLSALDEEAFAGLIMPNLVRLRAPPETENLLLKHLRNAEFRDNLIKGFEIMKQQTTPTPDARLVIVVEHKDLPSIFFRDIYNNLIAHSGGGEKTKTGITSIYIGYNLVRTALASGRKEGLESVLRHEVRDIQRGSHLEPRQEAKKGLITSEEAETIKNFYDEVLGAPEWTELAKGGTKTPDDREIKEISRLKEHIKSLGQKTVDALKGSVISFFNSLEASPVQAKGRVTLLALDTDIGNLHKNALGVMTELERESRRKQLGSLQFIRGSGEKLEGRILERIRQLITEGVIRSEEDVDIVLVAKASNLEETDYFSLIPQRKNCFTAGINDKNITAENYVPVMDILSFALVAAFVKDHGDLAGSLNDLYKKITGTSIDGDSIKSIIENGTVLIVLPEAKALEYEKLREMYQVLNKFLSAA